MRRYLAGFFLALFFIQSAYAADPAYANVQRSITGVVTNVGALRGFAANDPRIYNTLYGIGGAATAAAATAGAGLLVAGTAPAWGTVLAVAAIGGAISYAVPLGLDSLVKWAFGTPAATPISVTAPAVATGNSVITVSTAGTPANTIVANSIGQPYTIIYYAAPTYYTTSYLSTTVYTNPGPGVYTMYMGWTYNSIYYYIWSTTTTQSTTQCPTGYTVSSNTCVASTSGNSVTTALQTLTQAIASLTTAQNATALNSQTMATMINYLWQQAAAQPGYAGLPYVASQPVTQANVDAFKAANPTSYPNVDGLSTAVPSGSNGFYPAQSPTGAVVPATSVSAPTTVNPSTTPQINIGADPGIGSPTLETAPDGSTIMAPLLAGLSPYMSFSVSMPAGVCPAPTFDFRPVWNKTVSSSVLCTLYDSISQKIFTVMTLAWSVLFVIIVLAA